MSLCRLSRGRREKKRGHLIRSWAFSATILGGFSYGALAHLRAPQTTPVTRGKEIADRFGCFGCHGPGGTGGMSNPGSVEGEVPPLEAGGSFMFFVHNDGELREWILDGAPRRLQTPTELRPRGTIGMPSYSSHISDDELEDVMAYVRCVSYTAPPRDTLARKGSELAAKLGCFACHGAHGHDGLRNPGSFKGVIPPWDSDDYAHLVEDEGELREWILDGMIDRFARNPLASFFTDRQAIQMPAYRGQITDEELDSLVAYVNWTREEGVHPIAPGTSPLPGDDAKEGQGRSAILRGEYLYRNAGCATCHGSEGRGGVPNPNAAGGFVPGLDLTAERLQLFEPEEIDAVVAALDRGLLLDELIDDPPVEYFEDVLDAYHDLKRVILEGDVPTTRDRAERSPPMRMPAWSERVHADGGAPSLADIDALVAYLLTLQPVEELQ